MAEAEQTARFVAGCYAAFPRFEELGAYSMFYFAAASFSELSRRLNVHSEQARFLAADRAAFAAATIALSPASGPHSDYTRRVAEAIEPLNVAGLCDAAKQNWYGVDARDAVGAASKLGATGEQVLALFPPSDEARARVSSPCESPAG